MELDAIFEAKKLISPYIVKTPLIRLHALEEAHNCRIFLKCEQLQITGSFKLRGAMNALLHLTKEERKRGVITRSSGNFGQAVAYGAHLLGIPATIVMSDKVSPLKKELTEKFSPRLFFCKTRKKEEELVQHLSEKENLVSLFPYNHKEVIAGQGTTGLEIFTDLPTVQHVFCPIGGGGLMAGTSLALKAQNSEIETIGMEPAKANDYYLSRKEGKQVTLKIVDTIADGLRAPSVGPVPGPILDSFVSRVEIVSDEEIIEAMRILYEKAGLLIEPSGAITLAGLLFHPEIKLSGDTVCVLSGGNVVRKDFQMWIKKGRP